LSRELREEERQAWQRLVRVLGHELNNSLAPIKSIAGSLNSLLNREALPLDWKEDMRQGLTVIGNRAEALNRFTGAYARLAKLPPPRLQSVDLGILIRRIVGLETKLIHVIQSLS
jgi:nitrogen fixation/metabolism regulation signal transduction histidine kinase